MDRGRIQPVDLQRLCDHIDLGLAVAEDNAVFDVVGTDQGPQRHALGLGLAQRKADQVLGNVGTGRCGARGLDPGRIIEKLFGQAGDLRRHCGREEQRLFPGRGEFKDPLDVGDEAHVQHAVSFVHDHHLHAGQQKLAAFEVVEKPPGRGNQHVDATIELFFLIAERNTADEQSPGKLGTLGVALEAGRDLVG